MAGLRAWPLLLWVAFAFNDVHVPPQLGQHAFLHCHKEPCTGAFGETGGKADGVADCEKELAEFKTQLEECEKVVDQLENESATERAALRAEWASVTEQVANISAEVSEKEIELDAIEEANEQLHQELIESLGNIGLLQVAQDPGDDVTRWLACEDEKTSAELKARGCELAVQTTTQRKTSQRQHYEGLTDAAQQNVAMVSSRLRIVQQMIDSAAERNTRLTDQVAQVKTIMTSFATSTTKHYKGTGRGEEAEVKAAAQKIAEHRRKAREVDPVEEAHERLKTIDDDITKMRATVEQRGQAADMLKEMMAREAKVQVKVAAQLRKVKNETMVAFRKAFDLDFQLDQLETMHDDSYVMARNSTARWEAAARAEHEAVAELQTLVTQKHRYQNIVSGAEDGGTPDWAKEKKSIAAAVACFALLLTA